MGYLEEIEELEKLTNAKKTEKARLEERVSIEEGAISTLNTQIVALTPQGQKPEEFLATEEAELSQGIKECRAILATPSAI